MDISVTWKRIDSKTIRIDVSYGFNPDGSRKRWRRRFKTKLKAKKDVDRFAKEKASQIIQEEEGLKSQPGIKNLEDLLDAWLLSVPKSSKTVEGYRSIFNKAGTMLKITSTPADIIFYLNSLRKGWKGGKPVSEKTIKNHLYFLSGLYGFAVTLEMIQENPCDPVPVPKYQADIKDNFYTKDEIEALLIALEDESPDFKLAIHLALVTGCRLSELAGLKDQDFNQESNSLKIARKLVYTTGGGYQVEPPKYNSIREMRYPDYINGLLNAHLENERIKQMSSYWTFEGDPFLFTKIDGTPSYPTWISQRWRRFTKRHALRYITFHGLRHTNATYLLYQGFNIRNISARLGHSKVSTTMDIYTHVVNEYDDLIANDFEKLSKSGHICGHISEKLTIAK